MKNKHVLFFAIITLLIFNNTSFALSTGITELIGVLKTNEAISEIEVVLYNRPPFQNSDTFKISINETTKQFKIKIPIQRKRFGFLLIRKQRYDFSIAPNDKIKVNIFKDSLVFSGRGSRKNNFLFALKSNKLSERDYYRFFNSVTLKPVNFPDSLKVFKQNRLNFIDSYKKVPKNFKTFYKLLTTIEFERQVLLYPTYYSLRKRIDKDTIKPSGKLLDLMRFDNLIDDKKVISRDYISAIELAIQYKIKPIIKKDSTKTYREEKQKILFNSFSSKTLEYLLVNDICQTFEYENRYDSITIKKLKSLKPDAFSKKVLSQAINKYNKKQNLLRKPLQEAFANTVLIDSTNAELSFKEAFSQFKGKVVYLDFWATWCGPCIIEMPHSKKLKEKLKDKPVEFVYISAEKSDSKNWDKVFNISKTKKNHFVLKNGFESKLLKYMDISGIPTYMMFDKEGRLVDYYASRPSSIETELKLLELIKEKF